MLCSPKYQFFLVTLDVITLRWSQSLLINIYPNNTVEFSREISVSFVITVVGLSLGSIFLLDLKNEVCLSQIFLV